MSYLGRSAKLSLKAQEKVSFLATAGQTVKTGLSYTPSFVEVYVNGVLLTDSTDFTATNGNSITFTVALLLNDEVTVISLKTFTVADHYTKSDADTLLAAKATIANFTSTGIDDNATSTAVTIDASENVGIGTASPNRNLHVSGGAGDVAFGITNAATGTAASDGFSITVENPTPDVAIRQRENNDMKFLTNNTERMRIDSAGAVTKPYQPAFLARGLSSVPASASVFIYNSVTFDRTSSYSTSTGRFTAPVAGVYLFTFNSMGNISDSRYMCRLYLNGANFAQSSSSSNSSQYQDGKLSIHVNLAVSDYVYMYNAGPKVPHSTSATEEWFSGHLVG